MDYSPYVFKTILAKIQSLSLEQLEALGEALLDFSTLADLEGWLQGQARG